MASRLNLVKLPGSTLSNEKLNNSFMTEPAKSTIEPVQISFTGGLHYDEQGHLFREVIGNEPQYVGPPSPEIDAAWDDLLKGTS
jgi:hypothetical protein